MTFGEGKRLSSEPADALSQGEVEALDVVCLSVLLGTGSVLVLGHHAFLCLPEVGEDKVGEDEASFGGGRDLLPQLAAATHRA